MLPMKEIFDKLNFIKIKNSALWKIMSREWDDKSQTRIIYLQKTHPIKDHYSKYIKILKLPNEKTHNPILMMDQNF